MDASCKIQRSIHVFNITNKSMCPDFWVHIKSMGHKITLVFCKQATLILKLKRKQGPQ